MGLARFIFVLSFIRIFPVPCSALHKLGIFRIDVTCSNFGITTHIHLENGFEGVIYAENHYFNPICRCDRLPDLSGSISLFLPLNNCGTHILELDGYIYFANTIVIQRHRLAETAWDVLHNVSCKTDLPQPFDLGVHTDQDARSHHQSDESESWMEFKVGTDILSARVANELKVGEEFLLVVHLRDGVKNQDFRVTKCWAHDADTLDNSIYSIQIFDVHRCEPSDFMTAFTSARGIFNESSMTTYAKLEAFKLPSVENLQFTCSVEICRKSCLSYCDVPESSRNNHIVSKRKFKRSVTGEISGSRSLDERIRLMKATIKALGARLLLNRSQRHSENDAGFYKRMSKALRQGVTDSNGVTGMVNDSVYIDTPSIVHMSERGHFGSGSDFEESHEGYAEPTWNDEQHLNLTKCIIVLSSRESTLNYDFQKISQPANSCISKLRFSLVTAMLCCLLFCIILTCIGLALYLRKERKRHLIDNFLLYNFY